MQFQNQQPHEFSSKPEVIRNQAKFRPEQQEEEDYKATYNNLMYDKRVVRGNTYAPIVTSKTNEVREAIRPRPKKLQATNQYEEQKNMDYEPGTPKAEKGRVHVVIQTDEFVEALTDKPPEYEKDTQTDFYIDRPMARLFMPEKKGKDQETQIWDGDLFDFDYEVEPILQVLMGKTLEQSRMEVLEEEELLEMKRQQKKFEQLRNAELADVQKLEEKEKRLLEENERRKLQYSKKRDQNILAHQRLISRGISKNYLAKLKERVSINLEDQGVFRNPLEMSLLDQVLPWTYQEVKNELISKQNIEEQLDSLITHYFDENKQLHKDFYQKEMKRQAEQKERRRQEDEARAERRRQKELARQRKLELERRARITEQIQQNMVAKGEAKEQAPLFSNISDIDGYNQETPYVGLFGGILGEIPLFVQCLQQIGEEDEVEISNNLLIQKTILMIHKQQLIYLKQLFRSLLKKRFLASQIDVPIHQSINEKLRTLSEEGDITFENIKEQLANEERKEQVREILISQMKSNPPVILRLIMRQDQASQDSIEQLIDAFWALYFENEDFQKKVKFVPWSGSSNPKILKQAGIAKMTPPFSTIELKDTSDLYGQLQPAQEEGGEELPYPARNVVETKYEDKYTAFAPIQDDTRVMILHPVAELQLWNMIIGEFQGQNAGMADKEFNILFKAWEKMEQLQRKIMDQVIDDFPVFDMQMY